MEKIPWYSYRIKDTIQKLDTNPNGLTSFEAVLRLKKFGPNELARIKKKNEFIKFAEQFRNPLVYLLVVAAIITYFLKHNIDTIIILLIVLFNALIGYFQERKAEKSLEALKKMMALKTRVIRDDETKEIPATDIVPGDLVEIENGMKISADIRLTECESLKIDESILTGESVPVAKNIGIASNDSPITERYNMLYAGTVAATGHGLGIVVATGNNTEFAQIAKEVTSIEETNPLFEKIGKFSRYLLVATVWICVLIFIVGTIRGIDSIQMFLNAVATAVAVIPEGLPAIITITLALGVHRMSEQKAITKKLSAIETLGSITLIASDKTGTLTYNQMTVEKIYTDNTFVEISGDGYQPIGNFSIEGSKINPKYHKNINQMMLVSALCNNAKLIEEKDEWKIIGDPTEGALVVAADKAGIHEEKLFKQYSRLDEIPFDPKIQFMATLNHDKTKGNNFISVKGTLEKILSLSSLILKNGKLEILKKSEKEDILQKSSAESKKSYRILATAYKPIKHEIEKISLKDIEGLVFCGFSAIEDPPREDAVLSIKKCKDAGIRVVMITGDFPETAKAIAIRMGIADYRAKVLGGEEVEKLSDKELSKSIKDINIFARVTPELKLKIVSAFQKNKEIVGVTGDGINDAPILKLADVGIAMGEGGTDVAREASDIILVDNNFSTIVSAIEEGRTIYQNIRRAVFFLLSTNVAEAGVLFISLLIGLPIPFTAIQILWINLITDGASGFALAMEPKHEEVLKFKPRPVNEGIIDMIIGSRIIIAAAAMTIGTLLLYLYEIKTGASTAHAQTIAFVTIALFQIFNILNSRSFKTSIFKTSFFSNKYVTFFFFLMIALTIMTAQSPFFQNIFGTNALTLSEWIRVILVSLSIILVIEVEKMIRRIIKTKY